MSEAKLILNRLGKLINIDGENNFILNVFKTDEAKNVYIIKNFLEDIVKEINALATEITKNDSLISVKEQKLLRTCFQLIISFGISTCLIPGLGVSLSKRCTYAHLIPKLVWTDEQKYDSLTLCTNFLYRCYKIPILKNIIITFHLSDFLAALIQLAFAPLKKPGTYTNYTMTKEMYEKLLTDRQKYIEMYEYLVNNCFQPMLMKELLVLQNVNDKTPPAFVRRVIAQEMSKRLVAPGGLLSLIRCFLDSHDIDVGMDWKKIDMISRIVATKHGNMNEDEYLNNICMQLRQVLSLNNTKYLATATTCILNIYENFYHNDLLKNLVSETLEPFKYVNLLKEATMPGTVIMTPQDVDRSIQILYSCMNIPKLDIYQNMFSENIYVLFLLSITCSKLETKKKISDIILKIFEILKRDQLNLIVEALLIGQRKSSLNDILIEEYVAGLTIKYTSTHIDYPSDKAIMGFIELFNLSNSNEVVGNLLESCFNTFISIKMKRTNFTKKQTQQDLLNINDGNYIIMLNLLSEICATEKVINALKANPLLVINFVQQIFLDSNTKSDDECTTIAVVLLNTVLANVNKSTDLEIKVHNLIPMLKKFSKDETNTISILCKETLSLITSEYPRKIESLYQKAVSDVYDDLLPVRAHGIIELTKLIDSSDPETISKRHFLFCLFQEQLKDPDSYLYLSAINGIASLATHCTSEVLSVLCGEFLNATKEDEVDTAANQNKNAELRMKIGDIIVKTTRKLGEMAVAYKTTLLNTILCGCRDEDPLLRASALSNLAEIALVMHYKMGSIIYEVLHCVWSIIETDKAIECRRAAVMVISSLLKGLGKDTLLQLKDSLLPIYRTLNKLYKDQNEDSVVRLHAQIALEELNDIVTQSLFSQLPANKEFLMFSQNNDIKYK